MPLFSAILLASCGGGGSSGSDDTNAQSGSSSSAPSGIVLKITDAPVVDADIAEVWVRFTQVILHPSDGSGDIVHTVEDASDPNNILPYREIELKSLVGGKTSLLGEIPLAAGDYSWIRLVIDPDFTRIVETSGGEFLVKCPSCTKSGFKLVRSFDIETTGWVEFTIDFDLRKSITLRRPNQPRQDFDYILRPTLRILDAELASSFIHGTVDDQHDEINPDVCWVYVYEGEMTSVEPDDICTNADTTVCPLANRPLLEAPVQFENASGLYSYKTGPIYPGTYTVALVCEPDDPDVDEDLLYIDESEVVAEAVAEGANKDFILFGVSSLSLDKTLDQNADEDGSGSVTEGDTLSYRMQAINDGSLTLDNVSISDALAGLSALSCDAVMPTTLAPGDTLDCTATYVVQPGDAIISNTATAISDQTGAVDASLDVNVEGAAN